MKTPIWYQTLNTWVEGEAPAAAEPLAHTPQPEGEAPALEAPTRHIGASLLGESRRRIASALVPAITLLCCLLFTVVMLYTVVQLPRFGEEANATDNETARRYIEQGLTDVGATNLVTNITLVYRGFDTYGESCVLFLATTSVIILLRKDKNNTDAAEDLHLLEDEETDRAERSPILQHITSFLMPLLVLYGLYVLCNGHLSPGGGFAGGSILGAALILCSNAFGPEKVQSFFGHRLYHAIKIGALALYALLIGYTIFVGANGLENIIPLGKAGSIFSAGIILPINVAVGLEVACTMYAFYAYFSKGDL